MEKNNNNDDGGERHTEHVSLLQVDDVQKTYTPTKEITRMN